MNRPPYLYCPDMWSCHRAIRALYAAGYPAVNYTADELIELMNSDAYCALYPCVVYRHGGLSICALGWIADNPAILLNSPAHMVRYLRAHGKT